MPNKITAPVQSRLPDISCGPIEAAGRPGDPPAGGGCLGCDRDRPNVLLPASLTPEWTRQMSAAVRQAHYRDNRGDSGRQAANLPIETLIYGLFQFQIVAWAASVVIAHIQLMEQISSHGLDPAPRLSA